MCEVADLVACKRFQNKPSNRCEHVFNELCYEGLRHRLSIKQKTLDFFHDSRPAPLFFLGERERERERDQAEKYRQTQNHAVMKIEEDSNNI